MAEEKVSVSIEIDDKFNQALSKMNDSLGKFNENLEKPRDDSSMKLENDRGQDQNNSEQLKVELNESNEDENSF